MSGEWSAKQAEVLQEGVQMKALSIKQPWANLIAAGKKTIERRTWTTSYRGPLLIISSKRPPIEPAGYAVAIVDLVDCRPMTPDDEKAACCPIYENAVAWVLCNVCVIEPFPVKGQRGIFNIDIVLSDIRRK